MAKPITIPIQLTLDDKGAKAAIAAIQGVDKATIAGQRSAAASAAAVAELKGIRADLSRTEANMTRLAERQGEHGETLATHGARLADHARRIAQLEDHMPTNAPTQLRRPNK